MLTKADEKFLQQYEASLQGSKWRFVVKCGLAWALLALLLTTLANLFFDFKPDLWESPKIIAINLSRWLVAGLVYGFLFHWLAMRRYRKIKAKQVA